MTRVDQARLKRESGSVTVEFTFAILPLFALFFMILDVCWIVFGWACVQEGAREGVRYAITGSGQSETGLDNAIKTVVGQYSFGFAQTANVAIHYYSPGGYSSSGPPTPLDGTPGSTSAGNIIVITVPTTAIKSFGPLFRVVPVVSLSASASDVLQ